MKVIVNSSVLNNAIGVVSKVINPKSPLQMLSTILFQKKDGNLSLTASDGENMIVCSVPVVEIEDDVNFAIDGKYIQDAIKGFADVPLTIEVQKMMSSESETVVISYPNGHFSLPVYCSPEYPVIMGVADDVAEVLVDASILSDAISRTISSTADEVLRPVMNGMYFDFGENLTIVASDGHRLVRNRITNVSAGENVSNFILGKKMGNILKGILPKEDGQVSIKCDSGNAVFCFGAYQIVTRLIVGRYPNYNAVIPSNNNVNVVVDRKALIAAIKRVQPFSNFNSQLVCFDIQKNTLVLRAEDFDFSTSATESISCESECNMSIGFKGTDITELLSTIDSEEITILLSDPSRAALIEPVTQRDNQNVLLLLMPMLRN